MKSLRTAKGLLVVGTAVALSLGVVGFFRAAPALAQGSTATPCPFGNMSSGGMMGNGGMMGQSAQPSQEQCNQMGMMMNMMGGTGSMGNMMAGGMMTGGMMNTTGSFGPGKGMMGAWAPPATLAPAAGKTLTLDQATAIATAYVAAWNNKTALKIGDVMQFSNHFYSEAVETDTSRGAFEFLIDPTTGTVYAEPGPNMMWNLRYGAMGSAMGISQPTNDGDKMSITPDQAVKNAQDYLDKTLAGSKVEAKPLAFYGFYTLDILRDGKVAGMLSVNGFTGQVWLHQWHGDFVAITSAQ